MTVKNITGKCDSCNGYSKRLTQFMGRFWICGCCDGDIAMTVIALEEKGLLDV